MFSLAYLIADTALNRFAFRDGWTILWPLNGVNVALLLMRPRSQWLWMLLGVELGTGLGEWIDGNTMIIAQRFCSLLEVVLAALLLPRFVSLDQWLRTPRLFSRFVASLAIGPGISGVLAAALFHYYHGQPFLLAFNNWGTADALGIAVTLPLMLSLRSPQMRELMQRQAYLRTSATLLLVFAGAAVVFSESRYPLLFLLYPLLLLADYLLGFAGSAIAIAGVALLCVYLTTNGYGPFGQWPKELLVPRDLALQLYFGFHVIALFPASVVIMGRRRMAEALRDSNARLTVLATIDALTGIANRRSFDERLTLYWRDAARRGTPLALAMIDLDHFKPFNDQYGHVAGDRCLRAVGDVLTGHLRGPDDFVARFGGEEFAVLLPNTSPEAAALVSERIRATIHDLAIPHADNAPNVVTVSIGYASRSPVAEESPAGLIQLADTALYRAKHLGRNRVEYIASIEGLQAAERSVGVTTQNRLLRMLGRSTR